jgi:hypothetical protein
VWTPIKQVLLTGCSSGGLAVVLHCDQLRAFFPAGTTTTVKCLSDGGLYLDACVWFNTFLPCHARSHMDHREKLLQKPMTDRLTCFALLLQRGHLRRPQPPILLRRHRGHAGDSSEPAAGLHRPSRRHLGAPPLLLSSPLLFHKFLSKQLLSLLKS